MLDQTVDTCQGSFGRGRQRLAALFLVPDSDVVKATDADAESDPFKMR